MFELGNVVKHVLWCLIYYFKTVLINCVVHLV